MAEYGYLRFEQAYSGGHSRAEVEQGEAGRMLGEVRLAAHEEDCPYDICSLVCELNYHVVGFPCTTQSRSNSTRSCIDGLCTIIKNVFKASMGRSSYRSCGRSQISLSRSFHNQDLDTSSSCQTNNYVISS